MVWSCTLTWRVRTRIPRLMVHWMVAAASGASAATRVAACSWWMTCDYLRWICQSIDRSLLGLNLIARQSAVAAPAPAGWQKSSSVVGKWAHASRNLVFKLISQLFPEWEVYRYPQWASVVLCWLPGTFGCCDKMIMLRRKLEVMTHFWAYAEYNVQLLIRKEASHNMQPSVFFLRRTAKNVWSFIHSFVRRRGRSRAMGSWQN